MKFFVVNLTILLVLAIDFSNGHIIKKRFSEDQAKDFTEFYLYTPQNPTKGHQIQLNNIFSLSGSNFNPEWPVRFIIHGWINSHKSEINKLITNAYLKKGNFNVIVVSWGAKSLNNYFLLTDKIKYIGKTVGEFAKFLNTIYNVSFDNMYLIGHSLGAHIAGFAGKSIAPNQFNTIFALDPAGPDFRGRNKTDRIHSTDAKYVQSIHTDINSLVSLGYDTPIGHAAFYPNYGESQPGCLMSPCSHLRAYEFFAESIISPIGFIGKQCKDYNEISLKQCIRNGPDAYMGGEPANHNQVGVYYLPVNSRSPYAAGSFDIENFVKFELFTTKNSKKGQIINFKDSSTIEGSNFNSDWPVRFIISDRGETESANLIRTAYLQKKEMNVIVVNWEKSFSSSIYNYGVTAQDIGQHLASFAIYLKEHHQMEFDKTYLVGYGEGVNIAGYAAKFAKPYKFDTIFVLNSDARIDLDDANYIESIQTNTKSIIGHSTFFPNYGFTQPGCFLASCSNFRAVQYFAESINTEVGFYAGKCNSMNEIYFKTCKAVGMNTMGGEPSISNRDGLYYLKTNTISPFAIGLTTKIFGWF